MRALSVLAVAAGCLIPVQGPVVRSFEAPSCERCAGHRGVSIGSRGGDSFVAVAPGVVEFAGQVGERLYVVQRVGPDIRVTYGGMVAVATGVGHGRELAAGDSVGVASELSYLSVRIGNTHIEPLGALGLGRVRLVGPGGVKNQIVEPEASPR